MNEEMAKKPLIENNEVNNDTNNTNTDFVNHNHDYITRVLVFINLIYVVINIICYALTFGKDIAELQLWFLFNAFWGIITIWKSPIDKCVSKLRYSIFHFIAYTGIFLYYLDQDTINDEIKINKKLRLIQFIIASKILLLLTEFLFGIVGKRIYKIYDQI
jgi:hypothetical protein